MATDFKFAFLKPGKLIGLISEPQSSDRPQIRELPPLDEAPIEFTRGRCSVIGAWKHQRLNRHDRDFNLPTRQQFQKHRTISKTQKEE